MLFKLGLKNIKRNPAMNLLVILQMSVAFALFISMISTAVSCFQLYLPFKDEFNSKGYFYDFLDPINPETNLQIGYKDEFCGLIEGEKEVLLSYTPWFTTNCQTSRYVSYDEKLLEKYSPELESGSWFDVDKKNEETVQLVVSQNPYNYKVGDIITLEYLDYYEVKAEIIGILKKDAVIIDYSILPNGAMDYRSIYSNYNYEVEEETLYILNQDELYAREIPAVLNSSAFVTYSDDVPDEVIKKNNDLIKKLGVQNITPLSEMKEGSLKYIFSQILNLMPIFLSVLILTLVGAVSTAALSAKRQLKNYAVYYICGLKWKQCAVVNFWSSFLCVGISFILGAFATVLIKVTGLFGQTVVELGVWELVGCLVIMVVYVLLSILLPLNIIGNNTPNQVLRAN